MSDFPHFKYSMGEVKRAGEVLAGDLSWRDETKEGICEAFHVANNWRDAHAYPMKSMKAQMTAYCRHLDLDAICVARLKRMQAIRRKLRRLPFSLNQLQDLGGCRAIMSSISEVELLANALCSKSRHELRDEDDYIASPKRDGYRGRHLMFSFRGTGEAAIYDNRRVEIQVRTRLQHSWATAVEAIGLFRGEELKANQGSPGWLRLLYLMSAEFAEAEGCSPHHDAPPQQERVEEIRELDHRLRAAQTLDDLANVINWTEGAVMARTAPIYYLIIYDAETGRVTVEPCFSAKTAVKSYDEAEARSRDARKETQNIVLVEADKIEILIRAFPNYFGDVTVFRRQLNSIVRGKGVRDYELVPQERVPIPRREPARWAWIRRYFRP